MIIINVWNQKSFFERLLLAVWRGGSETIQDARFMWERGWEEDDVRGPPYLSYPMFNSLITLPCLKAKLFSAAATSPKEKEGKKRDKGVFGTAGRKAGAKLRHKLARHKQAEDQSDGAKSSSPTSSLPTPPKDEEIDDQGMWQTF